MNKIQLKNPADKMWLTIKIESESDGLSIIHFKDYREGVYQLTRLAATQLMDRIDAVTENFIKEVMSVPESTKKIPTIRRKKSV